MGRVITDNEAEQMLRVILRSWVRVFPRENITLYEIYISTDIHSTKNQASRLDVSVWEHTENTAHSHAVLFRREDSQKHLKYFPQSQVPLPR
ncbi:hypothetical protein BROSI_A0922 [Candidatus Brocadia sinica JPN1]|uniref:Uncharacterized protein n=1 Tax=Candidatus Brocadia sinica JPN1 TaxID=1197129 RepID=A0ABQ0JUL2_9BACT|nr:hypothetical protein BROSI_A0922 [Candidatus Brocadia sinica JPN1]GIK14044.1 MAG: hypothetical protein BroJett002_27510 [Candidatus Brocadia sinica]GJQ19085.1 MAG: hypothetical protein HBSIN01_30440 [Candidatus Brocadia sinica]